MKKFLQNLANKYNQFVLYPHDIKSLTDLAAFQKNSEIFQRVFKKMSLIKEQMHKKL